MLDKNGVEIKSGDIVEITGAFFKNDKGLYFVESSPGDPFWSGRDYCLKRITKKGKISKSKDNTCFWPIGIFVSDRAKGAQARRWNKEHAAIEVKAAFWNIEDVAAFFQGKADELTEQIIRDSRRWGENDLLIQSLKDARAHYEAVVRHIEEEHHE